MLDMSGINDVSSLIHPHKFLFFSKTNIEVDNSQPSLQCREKIKF
jgi:hypothetical protein